MNSDAFENLLGFTALLVLLLQSSLISQMFIENANWGFPPLAFSFTVRYYLVASGGSEMESFTLQEFILLQDRSENRTLDVGLGYKEEDVDSTLQYNTYCAQSVKLDEE